MFVRTIRSRFTFSPYSAAYASNSREGLMLNVVPAGKVTRSTFPSSSTSVMSCFRSTIAEPFFVRFSMFICSFSHSARSFSGSAEDSIRYLAAVMSVFLSFAPSPRSRGYLRQSGVQSVPYLIGGNVLKQRKTIASCSPSCPSDSGSMNVT